MKLYSYKIRLYPNNDQKEFLAKQFGCCRVVYNYMLDLKIREYIADLYALGIQVDDTNMKREYRNSMLTLLHLSI